MKLLKIMFVGFLMWGGNIWAVDQDVAVSALQTDYDVWFEKVFANGDGSEVHFASIYGKKGKTFGTNITVYRERIYSRWYSAPSEKVIAFLETLPEDLKDIGFMELTLDQLREAGEFISWFMIEGRIYKAEFCIWDKPNPHPFVTMLKFEEQLPKNHFVLIKLWLKCLGARKTDATIIF